MPDITSRLPYWLWPGDDRPPEEIDDEIAEELRFHLDMLAEEGEREGLETETARRQAAERFGDFDNIRRRCRSIKEGDAPMLRRFHTLLVLILVVGFGVLGWRVYAMDSAMVTMSRLVEDAQSELAALKETGPPAAESSTQGNYLVAKRDSPRGDVTGIVTGSDGEPIEGADVLLTLKDWPNNRYRQRDKALKTDAEGRFTMKRAVPLDGQYGINAAIVAPGHAIASRYVLVEEPGGEAPAPLDFKLTDSVTFRLNLTDARGEPLVKALVAPAGRNDSENVDHIVYHQGSNPAWLKADTEGVVEIDWFAPGDIGEVRVRQRGGEWQEVRVETPADGEEVNRSLEHWR